MLRVFENAEILEHAANSKKVFSFSFELRVENRKCDKKQFGDRLWSKLKYTEYTMENGNTLTKAFTGSTMVECFVELEYAPDREMALEYLSQILLEDVFERVDDDGDSNAAVFEGDDNAYYRWRLQYTESNDKENPIEASKVMLGLRNDYGGVSRWSARNGLL